MIDWSKISNNYYTSLSMQVLFHSTLGKGTPKIVNADPIGEELHVVLEHLLSSSLAYLLFNWPFISSLLFWNSIKLLNWASREVASIGEKTILGKIFHILAVSGGDRTGLGASSLVFWFILFSMFSGCPHWFT